MDRSQTIAFGDRVYVRDERGAYVECQVVGFNMEGEPILQAIAGPLRFRGVDRHVLDYPWSAVSRERPLPSLFEAARTVGELSRGLCLGMALSELDAALDTLRAVVAREEDLQPF